MTTLPQVSPEDLQAAALKMTGFDRVDMATRLVVAEMARRYDLRLELRHLVPIEGRPFITRDGLLHVAHRSGDLDGIVLEDEGETPGGGWWAIVAVYRKGMSHPFRYRGRYNGVNKKYGPEMAVKCAESMSLRRAFDVSLPAEDERFGGDEADAAAGGGRLNIAPPSSAGASGWRMNADRLAQLQAAGKVHKVPTFDRQAIVRAATNGRTVEAADGIPLYTEQEFNEIRKGLQTYKEVVPLAPPARLSPPPAPSPALPAPTAPAKPAGLFPAEVVPTPLPDPVDEFDEYAADQAAEIERTGG